MSTNPRSKALRVLAFSAAGLFAVATAALAADVVKEISTAAEHAGYAATSTDLKGTDAHLHHTINCLVGPKGKGFDAKEINPCKDLGNGAIPDTTDAAKKKVLEQALAKAEAGLKTKDLAKAKADAKEAETLLQKAAM